MPVLIKKRGEVVYAKAGGGFPTIGEKKTADKVDEYLRSAIPSVEEELLREGLFKLRKKNAIKLWYVFGKKLRLIWANVRSRFGLPDTELYIFLEAAQQHARTTKFSNKTLARHPFYLYFYQLAGFDSSFVEVAGTWRDWVEFFDSSVTKKDSHRVLEWLALRSDKVMRLKPGPVRKIMRAIRRRFRKIDTTLLDKDDLFAKLDFLLEEASNLQNSKAELSAVL